jgi:hypothetical protein
LHRVQVSDIELGPKSTSEKQCGLLVTETQEATYLAEEFELQTKLKVGVSRGQQSLQVGIRFQSTGYNILSIFCAIVNGQRRGNDLG